MKYGFGIFIIIKKKIVSMETIKFEKESLH